MIKNKECAILMLNFMYDHKGMMSVFTLVILIPIMIISALLMDFARINAIKANAAAAAETYANSYLSMYDELLNDLYGIMSVSQDDSWKADLDSYMKAAFTPNKVDTTDLSGTYGHFLIQNIIGSEKNNALSLTGNAMESLSVKCGSTLKNGSNYNALQMQISEYTKFIGPTELVITLGEEFANMLSDNSDGSDNANEVSKTKKNLENIQKKDEIDKELSELNEKIGNLYSYIKLYDSAYENLFNEMQAYLSAEIVTYYTAVNEVNEAMKTIKPIVDEIKSASYNADAPDDLNYIKNVLDRNQETFKNIFNKDSVITNKNGSSYTVSFVDIGRFFDNNLQGVIDPKAHHYDSYGLKNSYFNEIDAREMLNYDQYIQYWAEANYINCGIDPENCGCWCSGSTKLYDLDVNNVGSTHLCLDHLSELRNKLVNQCNDLGGSIAEIEQKINALIADVRANGEDDFADGLESDYSFFTGKASQNDENSGNEQQSKLDKEQVKAIQDLKKYDFEGFGKWFDDYASKCEGTLWSDFTENGLKRLTLTAGLNWDIYLMEMYSSVTNVAELVLAYDNSAYVSNSGNIQIFDALNIDNLMNDFLSDYGKIINYANNSQYNPYNVTDSPFNGGTFPLAFYNYINSPAYVSFWYILGLQPTVYIGPTPMYEYFTKLSNSNSGIIPNYPYIRESKPSWDNITYNGVQWSRVYEILSSWHVDEISEDESQNNYKDKAESLGNAMKTMSLIGENITIRGGKRRISAGDSTEGDDNESKESLADMVTGNNNNKIPEPESGVDIFTNKLMLMMYDLGMFTCQTSDMKQNKDNENKIDRVQPLSYQGVALAKENKASDGKCTYEESATNFLLYNELEYIFGGNADSQKNFNKVRNCLAAIRFVPNYINTYTIKEINNMISAVRNALAWCPLAAVIICQALRIGFAVLETWADLDLLYGGHSVLFTKRELGDLSLIAAVKAAAAKDGAGDDVKNLMSNLKDITQTDLNANNTKKSNGFKITYQQYLILLEMIFVSQSDMIKRTGDLIESNMNYVNDPSLVTEDGDVKVLGAGPWSLSNAYTSVEATVTVKENFVFIGNGTSSVFNTSDHEDVYELSQKEAAYPITVVREY